MSYNTPRELSKTEIEGMTTKRFQITVMFEEVTSAPDKYGVFSDTEQPKLNLTATRPSLIEAVKYVQALLSLELPDEVRKAWVGTDG